MAIDLSAAIALLAASRDSAVARIEASVEAATSAACSRAFLRTFFDEARAAARAADQARSGGQPPRLGGLAVSVKDLFDIAGLPTTAASKVLAGAPPAARDCTAVAR